METLCIQPATHIRGRWLPAGDKSISHRAVILGMLAEGRTEIHHLLEADDCLRTVRMAARLGATVERLSGGHWQLEGVGEKGLSEPDELLDAGNSGTTVRLMAGVLASYPIFTILTGDTSLRRRPMRRVVAPLSEMGAQIEGRVGGQYLPLAIQGGALKGIRHDMPIPSAQVKSCLLLAGLRAEGETVVGEAFASRDHTERILDAFGVDLEPVSTNGMAMHLIRLRGGQSLQGCTVQVPADFSSAAFLLTAALLLPGSDLIIERVGINPTRIGLLQAFAQGGAHTHYESLEEVAGEPIATLRVRPQNLRGMQIGGALVPRLIDEIPILAVAATQAYGETIIQDAGELRVKESDRIDALAEELTKMGANIEPLPDGLRIEGPTPLHGASVYSHGDHRIAMSLAVAGMIAQKGETIIQDTECIKTSFPDFEEVLQRLVL
jgi:3-phosphoshikimate 1-carboxyvinyltransferase